MRRFRPSAIIFTVSIEFICDRSDDHGGRPRRAEDDSLVGVSCEQGFKEAKSDRSDTRRFDRCSREHSDGHPTGRI